MGSRCGDTHTSSFDQGEALAAAAGQLLSGSVQLSDCQMLGKPTPHQKANGRTPKIILDGIPLQRTGSQPSLSSIESAESLVSTTSTSSNMTAMDVAASKKLEEIAGWRKKMNCKIGLIKGRLKEMSEFFERPKIVNKTVKHGVKDIVLWIKHVEEDHQ